jgi:hypothetical protein
MIARSSALVIWWGYCCAPAACVTVCAELILPAHKATKAITGTTAICEERKSSVGLLRRYVPRNDVSKVNSSHTEDALGSLSENEMV